MHACPPWAWLSGLFESRPGLPLIQPPVRKSCSTAALFTHLTRRALHPQAAPRTGRGPAGDGVGEGGAQPAVQRQRGGISRAFAHALSVVQGFMLKKVK